MKKLICAVILAFVFGSFSLANATDETANGGQALTRPAEKMASRAKSSKATRKHKRKHAKKKHHKKHKKAATSWKTSKTQQG